MPAPTGFTQHRSGYWTRLSDQASPFLFDGTSTMLVGDFAGRPAGATALFAASGNVANASAVATLAAAAGRTTYLSGLTITGSGSTLGGVVLATVTGLIGGATATYVVAVPTGVIVGVTPLVLRFDPPIPASAANTAIVVTLPALGGGNSNASVNAFGYQI